MCTYCVQPHYIFRIGHVDFSVYAFPASVQTRQTVVDDNWELFEMNNYYAWMNGRRLLGIFSGACKLNRQFTPNAS